MKKLFAFLFVIIAIPALAQQKKIKDSLVPESVLNGYKEKYKKTPVNNWYEGDGGYSAVFDKGEATYQAFFTNSGEWIRTVSKIKESAVSGAVKKAIQNTEWKDWKMSDSYKVETPEAKKLFEIHLKKGKEKKVILFDPTGKAMDIK